VQTRDPSRIKKTGVIEHLRVFDHAGLLANEPPGLSRAALHLVFRRRLIMLLAEPTIKWCPLIFAIDFAICI
jgi:hypothetical protein